MRYDPSQLVFGSTFFCVVIKISLWFAQCRIFLLPPLPTWFKTTFCVLFVTGSQLGGGGASSRDPRVQ